MYGYSWFLQPLPIFFFISVWFSFSDSLRKDPDSVLVKKWKHLPDLHEILRIVYYFVMVQNVVFAWLREILFVFFPHWLGGIFSGAPCPVFFTRWSLAPRTFQQPEELVRCVAFLIVIVFSFEIWEVVLKNQPTNGIKLFELFELLWAFLPKACSGIF